jgi:FkbM family methyltransferase
VNYKIYLHRITYRCIERRLNGLVALGDKEPWTILPDLHAKSFVVSGGAGYDISFELDLIEHFGCTVALLDPSPPGLRTIAALPRQPDHLHFYPQGLAAESGTAFLNPPTENQDQASWFIGSGDSGTPMSFLSLDDLLEKENRSSIDLMKIDIEGYEYEVLYSVLERRLPIRQICVEIHQGARYLNKKNWDRWKLVLAMRRAGYDLIHHVNWNHTFLHRSF